MPWGMIKKAIGGFYHVVPEGGDPHAPILCRARGVFRKDARTPLAGDRVHFTLPNAGGEGWIDDIAPRKNALIRPPVANVDALIIVQSLVHPPLSRRTLDRLTVLAEAHGIALAIVVTKRDLLEDLEEAARREGEALLAEVERVYLAVGYPVVLVNAPRGEGLENVKKLLNGRLTVFAGPSGVGKSTLIRALVPGAAVEVGEVSAKTTRGRHTTRAVELLYVEADPGISGREGGWIADTPGFSALELDLAPEALPGLFLEFRRYAPACRFRGCLHVAEPGCAVRAAVDGGAIDALRYAHYRQFLEELKEKAEKRYR
ncbi:MAG: ribosome small subunit-dependent GTPase A [Hydrogenibacillus sp.]|nr:ribosome small subunit-dependent GTPase A [Hydrogenibacillus sp.]